ncbi:MAG: nitroreductase family protein [Kofleriaceae bacterium]
MLDARSSVRELAPLTTEALGELLWHGARTRATSAHAPFWQHRAAASAGGLHPLEVVLLRRDTPGALRYDPIRHGLDELCDVDHDELDRARRKLDDVIPSSTGDVVVFLADLSRVEAAYENARSLVWRDAGSLLTTLHLVATALGLGMCQLGVLGHAVASALSLPPNFEAVGAATVGFARRTESP